MFSSNTSAVSGDANYIEDVFSTWLYTGTGSSQTITNGIDFSTKGGLAWLKNRSVAGSNLLFDTVRGADNLLQTNQTGAQSNSVGYMTTFNTAGFGLTGSIVSNASTQTYTSWSFREQAKFFDVVTYTGTGANRTVAHNLGSVPGCIIVKRTDTGGTAWVVYHTSLGNTKYLTLQTTSGETTASNVWNNTSPTSTDFTVGTNNAVNANGGTYVAYLFAHNAGGFGLTGTDNVISCGSFTADGNGAATIDLGYEPQWVLVKSTASTGANGEWTLFDTMRGWPVTTASGPRVLRPNSNSQEESWAWGTSYPTSTGFYFQQDYALQQFVYIAIRRGPMKTPTTGTSVFEPRPPSTTTKPLYQTSFPVDMVINMQREGGTHYIYDRMRGANLLSTLSGAAEAFSSLYTFDYQNGAFNLTAGSASWYVGECFRRAPGFFDVVCYTGTGSNLTLTHNLGVAPELAIVRYRSPNPGAPLNYWLVGTNFTSTNYTRAWLQLTDAGTTFLYTSAAGFSAQPTSTSIGINSGWSQSATTYVAYLFASCPGVSKVGSYTGTGALQTINCGFTGGARFVLIKRTDSTGDWFVYDSARGISSGNDPYLLLNSSAVEVTGTNYVDTTSVGFQVTAAAPAELNASGGTYIFLAIA